MLSLVKFWLEHGVIHDALRKYYFIFYRVEMVNLLLLDFLLLNYFRVAHIQSHYLHMQRVESAYFCHGLRFLSLNTIWRDPTTLLLSLVGGRGDLGLTFEFERVMCAIGHFGQWTKHVFIEL